MRISDLSSDVCSSDLDLGHEFRLSRSKALSKPALQRAVDDGCHSAGFYRIDPSIPHGKEGLAGVRPTIAQHEPVQPVPMIEPELLPDHAAERQTSRSEEHTSELQSLMVTSFAVFCLK